MRLFNNSENWWFVFVACRSWRALSPSESVKSFVDESMKNRRLSDKRTEVYTGPHNLWYVWQSVILIWRDIPIMSERPLLILFFEFASDVLMNFVLRWSPPQGGAAIAGFWLADRRVTLYSRCQCLMSYLKVHDRPRGRLCLLPQRYIQVNRHQQIAKWLLFPAVNLFLAHLSVYFL